MTLPVSDESDRMSDYSEKLRADEIRPIGSGITQYARRRKVLNTENPRDVAGIEQFLNSVDPNKGDWGIMTPAIDAIRRRWVVVKAQLPDPVKDYPSYQSNFVERETEAWYLRKIVKLAKAAESAIESGQTGEALALAWEIGDLASEFGMETVWKLDADAGGKARIHREDGAAMVRKHPLEVRVAAVEKELESGCTESMAIKRVAQKLGVSVKTVRRDYRAR